MAKFDGLSDDEIYELLDYAAVIEAEKEPSDRQVIIELSKYVPLYLFPHFKKLMAKLDEDFANTLRPRGIDFDRVLKLSPATLQQLFNIPKPKLVAKALYDLPSETTEMILDQLSSTNRDEVEKELFSPAESSTDEIMAAREEIMSPLRQHLIEYHFL